MYNLEELTSEVITLKLISGIEVLSQLLGVDEETGVITVGNPRIVVINGPDLALIPYIFTGPSDVVTMPISAILSVCKATDDSTADFESVINSEIEVESTTEIVDK